MIEYEILSATQAHQCLPELGDVLQACVKDGASIGFTDPNDRRAIDSFWKDKIYSLASHDCELFIARDNGFLAATVILTNAERLMGVIVLKYPNCSFTRRRVVRGLPES